MGRYTGPTCRLDRREQQDLSLKSGVTALKNKCNMGTMPGEHSRSQRRSTEKPYNVSLRNKQTAKRIYGIREKQFVRLYNVAQAGAKRHSIKTDMYFYSILERRLDNVIYRLGLASTRAEARQLISHGAVLVNASKCDIPSRILLVDDTVSIAPRKQKQQRITVALSRFVKTGKQYNWLQSYPESFSGKVVSVHVEDPQPMFNTKSIVEFYSK